MTAASDIGEGVSRLGELPVEPTGCSIVQIWTG
jgi:hypothetical protein